MEFDINKVYSAVNADEVKVGSKCFYEWDLKHLKEDVENNNEKDIGIVTEIYDESEIYRFQINRYIDREDTSDGAFALIYLIEPPKEPEYKPFSSVEKAIEEIRKHGGWVEDGGTGCKFLVLGYGKHNEDFCIYIGSEWVLLEDLFQDFIFADDGSPCGELVEE